jgi:chromosome segregation ATPase
MNNLLFATLCLALIYYFFFYLPTQKNNANQPLKHQATQVKIETDDKEIQTEVEGPSNFEQLLNNDEQINSLKEDIQQKELTITELNNSHEELRTKSIELIKELEQKNDERIKSFEKDLTDSRQANQKLLAELNLFTSNKELIKKTIELCIKFSNSNYDIDIEDKR